MCLGHRKLAGRRNFANYHNEYCVPGIIYSYGGNAAWQVADWLNTVSLFNPKPIAVNLVITCDPVPWLPAIPLWPYSLGGALPTVQPKNVKAGYSFYQQFDTNSMWTINAAHLPLWAPTNIWGRTVTGATNTQVTQANSPLAAASAAHLDAGARQGAPADNEGNQGATRV